MRKCLISRVMRLNIRCFGFRAILQNLSAKIQARKSEYAPGGGRTHNLWLRRPLVYREFLTILPIYCQTHGMSTPNGSERDKKQQWPKIREVRHKNGAKAWLVDG